MKDLRTVPEWEECLQASNHEPILLFKHSTRCPISANADRVVQQYDDEPAAGRPRVFRVKVVEFRPVSDEVARSLNEQHKSPQIILVKSGEAVWSASHYNITLESIQEAATRFSAESSVGSAE